jgi:hypothetical protein
MGMKLNAGRWKMLKKSCEPFILMVGFGKFLTSADLKSYRHTKGNNVKVNVNALDINY